MCNYLLCVTNSIQNTLKISFYSQKTAVGTSCKKSPDISTLDDHSHMGALTEFTTFI